jgi:hypothetical protein
MWFKREYYFFIVSLSLLWVSCANIVAPTGGPRDVKSPTIKKRSLADSAINFTGGSIEFDFDEFVQVKDIQNQLIITPLLKTNPKVKVHKKHVSIQMDDTLLERNTTYSISLGNAIQDIRESNPYANLNFTFSTGNYFDSLSLQGSVIEASTGKPDTSSLIVLYAADLPDSAFFKQKPLYIQKVQSGIFSFKNLPAKDFSIYALQDQNKNLRFDLASERIAFHNKKVNPLDSMAIILYSFEEEGIVDTTIKRKQFLKVDKGSANDNKTAIDPTANKLTYLISADTSSKTKRTFDITDTLLLRFSNVLQSFDVTKIRIFQDSILDASATVELDSARKKISILTQWTEDALYKVVLLKGFARDSSERLANAGDINFRTKRKSDYGLLTVQCKKEENDIVELLNNGKVISRKVAQDTTISFPLLLPDNYQVRIIHDKNENGKWDSGSLFSNKRQPELVELFAGQITIKANWENKIDLRDSFTKKPLMKK